MSQLWQDSTLLWSLIGDTMGGVGRKIFSTFQVKMLPCVAVQCSVAMFSAFNKLKQVTAFSVAELVSTQNPKIFIFNTGTNTDVVLFDVTIKLRIIAFIIWM